MALDEDLEFKETLEGKGYSFIKNGHIGQIWRTPENKAVKIIDAYLAKNKRYDFKKAIPFYESMIRERIVHQNLVEIYGVNDDANVAGYDHLSMEFITGMDLKEIVNDNIKEGKFFSIEDSVGISLQILSGLKYLHECEIPHKDLHGGNILLTKENTVKITDIGGPDATVTKAAYASPEQLYRHVEIDHRTDFYSFGVVLHEMLTNELEIENMTTSNTRIPLELENLILKLTKRDKRERHQSADEVIRDLKKVDYGLKGFQVLGDGLLGPSYLSPEKNVVKVLDAADISDRELVVWMSSGLNEEIQNHPKIVGYRYSNPKIDETHLQRRYIEGKSLEETIKTRGKFKGEETAIIMRDVMDGLAYAEGKYDLVHGNVKPSNIIIGKDGKLKVVDFLPPVLVQESAKNGRPREQERQYFHPAVLNGEEPTHKTDIYSIGAIAFRMISGEPYRPGKRLNLTARGDKELEELITDALML